MKHKYGNDLMLKDGDIIANPSGDLYTTDEYEQNNPAESKFPGFYNMYISLTDRMFTEPGDFVFHPEYESPLLGLISKPNSVNLKEHIREALIDVLTADPRVERVENVVIEQRNNEVYPKANVVMKGQSTAAEFVFPNFVIE